MPAAKGATSDSVLEYAKTLIPGYDPGVFKGDYWFDIEEATMACQFFEDELVHIEGEFAGQPFVLEPWQQAVVGNIFGWKRADGTRRYREAMIFVARKNGKMLDLQTPLPTPRGWTTMGEVGVGDELFDETGRVCNVTAATPVDPSPDSYRVKFSNGEEVVACADHQWLTTARVDKPGDKTSGRTKRPRKRVRTTRELFETQTYGSRGDRNHSIEMPGALRLESRVLPVDPYILGCWLGDGSSASAVLTSGQPDVEHYVREFAKAGVEVSQRTSRTAETLQLWQTEPGIFGPDRVGKGRGSNLQRRLRVAGVLGNKHIPQLYLRASVDQRTALLQGLMDTDGTADRAGRFCEYVTTNPHLRDGFQELIAGLGIKAKCRDRPAKIAGREVGRAFRFQFVPPDGLDPFRMDRKAKRFAGRKKPRIASRSRTVQIVSVDRCDPVPMRCISVDSPSSLYRFGRTMLPTHNTLLVAGLALRIFFCDAEPGAQILVAAAEREQAGLLFGVAREMVVRNKRLKDFCTPLKKLLAMEKSASKLKPISSEASTKHGMNAHAAIIDELHAQPNADLYDVLMTSMGARRQPLMIHLTTSDFDREGSICNEKHDYACRVRDGIIEDETFLPVIYEASVDDDWTDRATWAKANPNLGVSVSEEFLAKECATAQAIIRYENTFKRLYLNIRTGQETRWLAMEAWDACTGTAEMIGSGELTLAAFKKYLAGKKCYAGLDLSSNKDLTAFVLVFPFGKPGERPTYFVLPYFWVPMEEAQERERRDGVNYFTWAREGWIEPMPGRTIDYEVIFRRICSIAGEFDIQGIAFDHWQSEQLAQQLDKEFQFDLARVQQRMANLSWPSKELEKLVLEGRIVHGGNPVLRWNAANCATVEDQNGNIMPSKKKSGEKIDGIAAAVMGLGLAMEGMVSTGNVYDDRPSFLTL